MSYWAYLRGQDKPAPEPETAMLEYASWQDVPSAEWPWPNFKPEELACKGTGRIKLRRKAVAALQEVRKAMGRPLVIASAYRTPEHNAAVGGAKNSQHMEGHAFDVVMTGHDPHVFEAVARKAGFRGFGFYPAASPPFIHIDMGEARSWGTRYK